MSWRSEFSRFEKAKNIDLKFSDKDAEDFVNAAKAQEGGLYQRVVTKLLPNDKHGEKTSWTGWIG